MSVEHLNRSRRVVDRGREGLVGYVDHDPHCECRVLLDRPLGPEHHEAVQGPVGLGSVAWLTVDFDAAGRRLGRKAARSTSPRTLSWRRYATRRTSADAATAWRRLVEDVTEAGPVAEAPQLDPEHRTVRAVLLAAHVADVSAPAARMAAALEPLALAAPNRRGYSSRSKPSRVGTSRRRRSRRASAPGRLSTRVRGQPRRRAAWRRIWGYLVREGDVLDRGGVLATAPGGGGCGRRRRRRRSGGSCAWAGQVLAARRPRNAPPTPATPTSGGDRLDQRPRNPVRLRSDRLLMRRRRRACVAVAPAR